MTREKKNITTWTSCKFPFRLLSSTSKLRVKGLLRQIFQGKSHFRVHAGVRLENQIQLLFSFQFPFEKAAFTSLLALRCRLESVNKKKREKEMKFKLKRVLRRDIEINKYQLWLLHPLYSAKMPTAYSAVKLMQIQFTIQKFVCINFVCVSRRTCQRATNSGDDYLVDALT